LCQGRDIEGGAMTAMTAVCECIYEHKVTAR